MFWGLERGDSVSVLDSNGRLVLSKKTASMTSEQRSAEQLERCDAPRQGGLEENGSWKEPSSNAGHSGGRRGPKQHFGLRGYRSWWAALQRRPSSLLLRTGTVAILSLSLCYAHSRDWGRDVT